MVTDLPLTATLRSRPSQRPGRAVLADSEAPSCVKARSVAQLLDLPCVCAPQGMRGAPSPRSFARRLACSPAAPPRHVPVPRGPEPRLCDAAPYLSLGRPPEPRVGRQRHDRERPAVPLLRPDAALLVRRRRARRAGDLRFAPLAKPDQELVVGTDGGEPQLLDAPHSVLDDDTNPEMSSRWVLHAYLLLGEHAPQMGRRPH